MSVSVSVVLAVHNGMKYLPQQIASIQRQTRLPDQLVVVDDFSNDESAYYVERQLQSQIAEIVTVQPATKRPRDLFERIGSNFYRGILSCSSNTGIVIFSDQDDIWLPDRVERHVDRFMGDPGIAMTTSDGWIVDENSNRIGGTLREAFGPGPVWNSWGTAEKARFLIGNPCVVGAASAVRMEFVSEVGTAEGWLHDRWFSLAAAAIGKLDFDPEKTIEYRIHSEQSAGLSPSVGRLRRIFDHASNPQNLYRKIGGLKSLRELALEETSREFSVSEFRKLKKRRLP